MTSRSLVSIAVTVFVGLLVALAGGFRGDTVGSVSVFALCAMWALLLNWAAFVPSYMLRTEHYYDLTGSITYISSILLAFALTDERDLRTTLLVALVLIWAARLGTFLFRRVKRVGKDGRFDKVKHDWAQFLMFWTIQALWVVFTSAAALAAITSGAKTSFGIISGIGFIVWLFGFGIEVIADQQKAAFRADPSHEGQFIHSGLWAKSRHPNYFGELSLWIGIALIAAPVLRGWQYVTLLSPVFVFLLLTRISGLPALEARANKKWGGQPDYEAYKDATPVFFPRL